MDTAILPLALRHHGLASGYCGFENFNSLILLVNILYYKCKIYIIEILPIFWEYASSVEGYGGLGC